MVNKQLPKYSADDRDLGMDSTITRRDFLNGVSIAVGASLVAGTPWLEAFGIPDSPFAPEKDPSYYPPAKTGMRGSHDGSFEVAHDLRDGKEWPDATADNESYDLIVVGGGISGLAAAYFFRKFAGADSKILILDNHDDFGGHAKRNEFRSGNRLLLGYGGTQSIEAPAHYSAVAKDLLKELGIDVQRFYQYYDQKLFSSMKLNEATFFDKETFGEDRLVFDESAHYFGPRYSAKVVDQMPVAPDARRDLLRLQDAKVDYLPGLTPEQKRVKLIQKSYKDFLLQDVKTHPDVPKIFQTTTHDLYAVGVDAVSAYDCAQYGFPGFEGMTLPKRRSGDDEEEEEPYIFHFPDGNASIARLLVRSLVPGSAPGSTMEDIVTARMTYAKLDDSANKVRMRLNSTAVRAKHVGDPQSAKEVEVTYVRGGQAHRVRAASCVLACYNMVIPYLCPEMSVKQKEALAYAVKIPLVYTNVQIKNWKAFQKLGLSSIYAPGAYFSNITLDFPVSMGQYKFPASPDEPCVLHLLRTPCKPGLPCKDQYRAGRWELFTTKFETFERNVRDELGRILAGGGFDPASDIEAITVNRWPHGYAYEYNRLFEPLDRPAAERPCVIGRQPFGRITIANSDADGHAYTNIAIDQGHRAVKEVMAMRTGAHS
ncbi:MAG TPA: NAD(P)-binding protein [Candidatus Sulfotelmatobacter sp.]|jgi:spermidine dehydrogenase|nr:NAD(P)-binding protein [Candidatus Sulfotelmatobacter sp.]